MWIPSVLVILPKTLLKWTTPHCKSATKFKAKIVKRRQLQAESEVVAKRTTTTTTLVAVIASVGSSAEAEAASATATAAVDFSAKQYSSESKVESSPTSLSFIALVLSIFIKRTHHYIHQFLLDAVITKLAVLMNDFRLKLLKKPAKTTTTTTRSTTNVIIEQIIALIEITTTKVLKAIRTVFVESKQQYKNNKKNNSTNDPLTILTILPASTKTTSKSKSKSASTSTSTKTKATTNQIKPNPNTSKTITITNTNTNTSEAPSATPILPPIVSKNNITVAALVTLRLFNNNSFSSNNHRTYNNSSKSNKVFLHYTPRDPRLRIVNSNQEILFNKHHFDSVSELKITEDLCAYGELIGGSFSTPAPFKGISANLVYCDCNKRNCCCNRKNNTNSNCINNSSESESESLENNFIGSELSRKKEIVEAKYFPVLEEERREALLQISEAKFLKDLQLGFIYLKAAITTVGFLL
ncbi:PREDICTED: rho GTPase-activating protein gacF [Rhagoletis zephyria]|uniref:rho GTPase-activating protein gacF n=1 Tax=Rhagoletis zephyria TaxID=28612 RepID=UPI00081125DA|nr:PREDICTED: rho GTPase-activating protein gacF [Rhagoletis zephyria]XP_017460746.1 PREDICTED: rho GTPase-activating protein gacF [Rhagoletis zephyria]